MDEEFEAWAYNHCPTAAAKAASEWQRARIRREIDPYLEKAKAQRIEDPVTWELIYRLERALGGEDG